MPVTSYILRVRAANLREVHYGPVTDYFRVEYATGPAMPPCKVTGVYTVPSDVAPYAWADQQLPMGRYPLTVLVSVRLHDRYSKADIYSVVVREEWFSAETETILRRLLPAVHCVRRYYFDTLTEKKDARNGTTVTRSNPPTNAGDLPAGSDRKQATKRNRKIATKGKRDRRV